MEKNQIYVAPQKLYR